MRTSRSNPSRLIHLLATSGIAGAMLVTASCGDDDSPDDDSPVESPATEQEATTPMGTQDSAPTSLVSTVPMGSGGDTIGTSASDTAGTSG